MNAIEMRPIRGGQALLMGLLIALIANPTAFARDAPGISSAEDLCTAFDDPPADTTGLE